MKNLKNKIIMTVIASLVLAGSLIAFADKSNTPSKVPTAAVNLNIASTAAVKQATPAVAEGNYLAVTSLEVVNNPAKYMNKNIKFKATFDKFSTLGLDYKPAFRDSEKYISFLIKRDDVTDHTVPLAEMKIFIKRTEAEKFIELDSGDIIEVYGKVFSDALTDTWLEADKIIIIDKKNKDKTKKADK